MAIPFARPAYDNSRNAARLSDLILRRGENEAEGIRNRGAAWGEFSNVTGRLLSDLAKAKADEPRRRLQRTQEERLQNQLKQEDELAAIVKANRDPLARAEALEQAGFMTQAKAVRDQIKTEQAASNTDQFTALQATYGQDDPNEVINQGMSVAPKETLAFQDRQRDAQKAEDEKKDRALTRDLTRASRLPTVMTSVANVRETP